MNLVNTVILVSFLKWLNNILEARGALGMVWGSLEGWAAFLGGAFFGVFGPEIHLAQATGRVVQGTIRGMLGVWTMAQAVV